MKRLKNIQNIDDEFADCIQALIDEYNAYNIGLGDLDKTMIKIIQYFCRDEYDLQDRFSELFSSYFQLIGYNNPEAVKIYGQLEDLHDEIFANKFDYKKASQILDNFDSTFYSFRNLDNYPRILELSIQCLIHIIYTTLINCPDGKLFRNNIIDVLSNYNCTFHE